MIDRLVIWDDLNILRAVRVYVARLRSAHWREASRCPETYPMEDASPKENPEPENHKQTEGKYTEVRKQREGSIEYAGCCRSVSPRSASTHVTAA